MPELLDDIREEILPALAAPLEGRLVPSPYNFEFTGEDALRIMVHNSQTGVVVRLHYRMQPAKGAPVAHAYTITPDATRLSNTRDVEMGRGYLLNVVAFASEGDPIRGQTFVRVDVIRGRGAAAIVLATILQDYVTEMQPVAWPGSPLRHSFDGDGYFRIISGTDPAAQTEISEAVPSKARWRLEWIRLRLVTDADAGNRRPRLLLKYGGNRLLFVPAPGTTPASETQEYFFTAGLQQDASYDTDVKITGLPRNVILLAAATIETETASFNAGDKYDAPVYGVREWLEVF